MNLTKLMYVIASLIVVWIILFLALLIIETTGSNQGFTELYFLGIDNLPKVMELDKEYSFAFAIHNLENKKTTYQYTVYLNSIQLKQGIMNLEHDKTAYINQSIILRKEQDPIKISVRLSPNDREIHFWADLI